MVILLKFALADPDFYNGLIGPVVILVALYIAAKALRTRETTGASIATAALMKDELEVVRDRYDRCMADLGTANKLIADLTVKTSLEPVMEGLAKLMLGLTEATQEMVTEIRESTAQATQRHEAVMKKIERHESQAQQRHDAMMAPLEKMANAVGSGT